MEKQDQRLDRCKIGKIKPLLASKSLLVFFFFGGFGLNKFWTVLIGFLIIYLVLVQKQLIKYLINWVFNYLYDQLDSQLTPLTRYPPIFILHLHMTNLILN